MRAVFAFVAILELISGFSIGEPPTCEIVPSQFGCHGTFFEGNQLNCTDSPRQSMHWAYAPVATSTYTVRTGDAAPGADPTLYTPNELVTLYIRTLEYTGRFRGIIIYAEDNAGNKVGSWDLPESDSLYMAPWDDQPTHPCHAVALHSSARLKPFVSQMTWRAPDEGVGQVTFKSMIKWGDANTGAFFLPAELVLEEGAVSDQTLFQSDVGETCTDTCIRNGGACDLAGLRALDSEAAFSAAVLQHYPCNLPLMESCVDTADPQADGFDWCHYQEGCSANELTLCDSVAEQRFCACSPDPCEPSPCIRGTCADNGASPLTEDDFVCTCEEFWSGPTCNETAVPPCSFTGEDAVCQNGGTCVAGTGLEYTCTCPTCVFGDNCETAAPCDSDPCGNGGTCMNVVGSSSCDFTCDCPAPYLVGADGTCSEIDGCHSSQIPADYCQNGGVCVDLEFGLDPAAFCQCAEGWTGTNCELSVNDCSGHNLCNNGTCVDQHLGFVCDCAGLTPACVGQFCECCDGDLDPSCVCNPNPCQNAGTCNANANEALGYDCTCAGDFVGPNCEFPDPCAAGNDPCLNGGTCVRLDPAPLYECTCPQCYQGAHCDVEPPCAANPCGANSDDCTNVPGPTLADSCAAECTCSPGWMGDSCTEYDCCFLQANQDVCANGGVCRDLPFGADTTQCSCTCPPGYAEPDCVELVDYCAPVNPCLNGGTCNSVTGGYTCSCPTGYYGATCETMTPEGACTPDPCVVAAGIPNGIAGCVTDSTAPGGYTCTCNSPFTGDLCTEAEAFCVRADGSECGENQGRGLCVNVPDDPTDFDCDCNEPFMGDDCASTIDYCASDPCLNGGTCSNNHERIPGQAGRTCSCPSGFTGTDCQFVGCTCSDGSDCPNNDACDCPGAEDFATVEDPCRICIDATTTYGQANPHRLTCKNGGTCRGGAYPCECLEGFWGTECQYTCVCPEGQFCNHLQNGECRSGTVDNPTDTVLECTPCGTDSDCSLYGEADCLYFESRLGSCCDFIPCNNVDEDPCAQNQECEVVTNIEPIGYCKDLQPEIPPQADQSSGATALSLLLAVVAFFF